MNTLYKRLRSGGLVMLSFMLLTTVLHAQTFLEIPVKLEVEKGDLNDVVVKVRKDGKDAFTQSGASKMRFKFDYNRKYSLIFTKPGYITKTIEINSNAPSARISQGFDPYKIGVKLFLQNEENKVVYNQPVAHIKYDQNLDEFNFDTDYSKSILSAMNTEDDTDKKEDAPIARDVPEEKPAPPPISPATPSANSDPKPPSQTLASTTNSDPIIEDNKKDKNPSQDTDIPKPYTPISGNDNLQPSTPSTGDDKSKIASVNSGDDKVKKSSKNEGEEKSKKLTASADSEKKKSSKGNADKEKIARKLVANSGDDTHFKSITPQSGSELQNDQIGFQENEKITREDIIEKNRVITKVRVMKGSQTTEYSRVNYSWGGLYFFKNANTSIPENLFVQWTGVNRE